MTVTLLKHLTNSVRCFPPLVRARKCSTNANILHHYSLTVPSFGGSLLVKSPYQVNIKPTNTMEYPNLDQAFIKVNIPSIYMSVFIFTNYF